MQQSLVLWNGAQFYVDSGHFMARSGALSSTWRDKYPIFIILTALFVSPFGDLTGVSRCSPLECIKFLIASPPLPPPEVACVGLSQMIGLFSRCNNFTRRGMDIQFAVTCSSAHDVICTLEALAVLTVSSRCSAAFPVRWSISAVTAATFVSYRSCRWRKSRIFCACCCS